MNNMKQSNSVAAATECSLSVDDWIIEGESKKCLILRKGCVIKPLAVFINDVAVEDYTEVWEQFAEMLVERGIISISVD